MRCFCGCGKTRGLKRHHVVYQQELRRIARSERFEGLAESVERSEYLTRLKAREMALVADRRNMVPVGFKCHAAHHNRSKPYPLNRLSDSAYSFALEVLGAGPAYEYLKRRYAGEDPRLDALIAGERDAA